MRSPLGPQGKDSCGQVARRLTMAANQSGGNLRHGRSCTMQPFSSDQWSSMSDHNRGKMFDRLMASQGPAGLSAEQALEQVGLLIDLSGDLAREEGTARALEWADELERGSLSASDAALLKYFRGNAWANRQKARRGDSCTVWRWEQPELQEELLHLRSAVQHMGFPTARPAPVPDIY